MEDKKCIRKLREELERKMLCEYASFSDSSLGRDVVEEPDEIRGTETGYCTARHLEG